MFVQLGASFAKRYPSLNQNTRTFSTEKRKKELRQRLGHFLSCILPSDGLAPPRAPKHDQTSTDPLLGGRVSHVLQMYAHTPEGLTIVPRDHGTHQLSPSRNDPLIPSNRVHRNRGSPSVDSPRDVFSGVRLVPRCSPQSPSTITSLVFSVPDE